MNNLYGGSQAMSLPYSDFNWENDTERFADPNVWKTFSNDNDTG